MNRNEELMTAREAAVYLNRSSESLYDLVHEARIPHVRLKNETGFQLRFRRDDLDKFRSHHDGNGNANGKGRQP